MGSNFNPADIQATGVGLAAFLATVLAVFIFLSARRERLGFAIGAMLTAAAVWAWFGFLYHIVPDISLARGLRVVSVIGIVWMNILEMNFAVIYASERMRIDGFTNIVRWLVFVGGAIFTGLLLSDLFGTRYIVGALSLPPSQVLAPDAGPLMILLVLYYIWSTSMSGILLALRARAGLNDADRRQAVVLFASITIGLALGGTRFTPWFGFDFYPLVGDIGFPLFAFSALYSVRRYGLLNVQVAAAQILVFLLWTFTFFRMLINPSVSAALPDIGLFLAVLVLGMFLLRSVVNETRAQKELAQLTIDRVKSEFVTIAAHQLRTPLSALRWAFSLLLTDSETPLTQAQREIAQKGARAADNMMALADDLLNVARMSDKKFTFTIERGDVRDTVRVAVSLLEDQARAKHIRLSVRLPESVPAVDFDRGKLAFALENLVDNAIKYTPEGGEVTVEVSASEGRVALVVRDTGTGISAVDRPRIFERFFRGASAVRMSPDGSGLGLFVVKTIVEGHGGEVSVSSQEGRGTTVTITLRASGTKKA